MDRHDNRTVVYDVDVINKFLDEATPIYKIVKTTLGAGGRNVIITDGFNDPIITKDGVTAAVLSSTMKDTDSAAIIIKNASLRTNEESGDGTTSTVIYSYNLLKNSAGLIEEGMNPVRIKKGMDIALKEVVMKISEMSKEGNLYDIAMVSSNNDKEISDYIVTAYTEVGRNGMVNIVKSDTKHTSINFSKGIVFDKGWLDPVFSDNGSPISYNKSLILIVDDYLDKPEELIHFLSYSYYEECSLIVIAHKFSGNVINLFGSNRVGRNQFKYKFPVILIEAPFFGEKRVEFLTDLANCTGATIISDKYANIIDMGLDKVESNEGKAMSAKNVLGSLEFVSVDKNKTTLVPVKDKWEEYILSIEETEENLERIATLKGKTATILLGGNSEVEVNERFDRLEDTKNSVRNAMKDGVVIGAGMCMYSIKKQYEPISGHKDVVAGHKLVYDVLDSCAYTIAENAGFDKKVVDTAYTENGLFNVNTEMVESYDDTVITDPANTAKSSITNAVSTIGTLITSGAYVRLNN